ncbi:MAG: serpin family protein [Synergistaceae bacterium]|nr:serpin family protein [Synergistaceae bacterium]
MTLRLTKIALSLAFILASASRSFAAVSLTESINAFALDSAKILAESNRGKSFFFSPYSIITAFGMAYAGSAGKTAAEIEHVMRFSPEFHKSLSDFAGELESDTAITSANRVWLCNGLNLRAGYESILTDLYRSPAAELDFKNDPEGSRKTINDWASAKTNGRISNLLAKVLPDTQMILTNAVYFNAKWSSEFNEDMTQPRNFALSDSGSETVRVPMMAQYGKFLYYESGCDGTKLIKLPYKGRMSMLVMLPAMGKTGLEYLTPEGFAGMIQGLSRYEVDLWLPKFTTEDSYELKDLFAELGVNSAFSDSADFSGITQDEKLKVDSVIHKTFIEVDETKTEAAAATAITMVRATAVRPVRLPKAEFHADRPFIYFIVDDKTNAILFMGRQTFRK